MSAPPTTAGLPEGHVIGDRYRVVRLLGAGGVAAVYEAENTWTSRRVALKVLDLDGDDDARAARRFRVEAVATAKLCHPHVADVLDMGEDRALRALFLAQELLDGCDLRARLDAAGPMTARDAIDVAVPVAATLAFAHERGVIHRDIKPENLFLARGLRGEQVVKVIDFGLALHRGPGAPSRLTEAGAALGTAYYMAPEQCRGDLDLDGRADVWALGAVLFEMLTGAPPFDAPTYAVLVHRILSEVPPRADLVAPAVPSPLADVIARALAPDRAARTPDMRKFLAELLACPYLPGDAADESLRERHRGALDLVDLTPTAPPSGPEAQAERARAETQPRKVIAAGRSRRFAALVALALALAFAFAGAWRAGAPPAGRGPTAPPPGRVSAPPSPPEESTATPRPAAVPARSSATIEATPDGGAPGGVGGAAPPRPALGRPRAAGRAPARRAAVIPPAVGPGTGVLEPLDEPGG
jgi:serine/threonine-protein kinase